MSFSFSINSKSQSNRIKRTTASFSDDAAEGSSTVNYVREFDPSEAPSALESNVKAIAPIPDAWLPNKKLKNLQGLSNGEDSALQFELDPGSNPEAVDNSMDYGLNLRQPSGDTDGVPSRYRGESISHLELRKLREDLEKVADDPRMDDFTDVPVEEFGVALLSGYGWKEGGGIGPNAKEDVKIVEAKRKTGRGRFGFTRELPENWIDISGRENLGSAKLEKMDDLKEKKGFGIGKEVRIVNGREMGMKGKVVEVRSGGDLLVVRISGTNERVKVRSRDVAEVGSGEKEKCLRKLKELKTIEKNVNKDKREKSISTKRGREEEKAQSERVHWLRNHIRVRIISKELKGGRLHLKKGVVVDVVGPGICDILIDQSKEIVQGVDQELLETALPKRGGPVLVLYGRHSGVYGNMLKRDSEKEIALVQDADTHELFNVRFEQISEYTGDLSDIGY